MKINIKESFIIIVTLVFIILLCFLTLSFFVPEKYRIQYSCQNCSIGKVEIAGDYSCGELNGLDPLSLNCRDIAIRDCVAFNKYQEIIDSKEYCVV